MSYPFGMKDGEIHGSDTDQIIEVLKSSCNCDSCYYKVRYLLESDEITQYNSVSEIQNFIPYTMRIMCINMCIHKRNTLYVHVLK
jgi:hypothetical protein